MGTINGDTKVLQKQRPHRATESSEAKWAQGLNGYQGPLIYRAMLSPAVREMDF